MPAMTSEAIRPAVRCVNAHDNVVAAQLEHVSHPSIVVVC